MQEMGKRRGCWKRRATEVGSKLEKSDLRTPRRKTKGTIEEGRGEMKEGKQGKKHYYESGDESPNGRVLAVEQPHLLQ